MASETEICNLALARCGQGAIVNIEDSDRLSRLCKLHYVPKRNALLRRYRWKFATARASLPANATVPVFGYARAYTMPIGCLRVLSVNDLDPEFDPDLDPSVWDIEGRAIVTDEAAPISVKYIKEIEDPDLFDASFQDALAAYLAMYLVPSFRETETSIMASLEEGFMRAVMDAKFINAIEGRPRLRRQTRSNWVQGSRW